MTSVTIRHVVSARGYRSGGAADHPTLTKRAASAAARSWAAPAALTRYDLVVKMIAVIETWDRGHFYGMTTHSRGAVFLMPAARAVVDIGALHARAMKIDERSRVLNYKMTSQCASGTGQFLENVARYLGIALEDVGPMSLEASTPEVVSSICTVLAETDVINMVSRGIKPADILKRNRLSMAGRYVKLLRAMGVTDHVALTGGLAADVGLTAAMREKAHEDGLEMEILTHPHSDQAGTIGAALWAAYRQRMLDKRAAKIA